MRIEVAKAFLSKEECDLLNQWVNVGVVSGWLDKGHAQIRSAFVDKRLTSRLYGHRFNTPPEILAISKKVRRFVGVDTYPLVTGHGRDGIVVSCTFSGGNLHEHVDPRNYHDLATLRCNVLTQKPEVGGILHIEGETVEVEVGDLHCYLASEHAHKVSTVGGNTPRILWMFGACVPSEAWNNNTIKFKGNHELS
jgi:hypothetical protein